MAALNIPKGNIGLNFAWVGPNTQKGGVLSGGCEVKVVDLLFQGTEEIVCVRLPPNINPSEPKKFNFTRIIKWKDSSSEQINVTEGQIRNLALQVGLFHNSKYGKIKRPIRNDTAIKLEIPKKLELGKLYILLISSNNLSLSARLI